MADRAADVKIKESLQNNDLWERLHERFLQPQLLQKLTEPEILNEPNQVTAFQFHKDKNDELFVVLRCQSPLKSQFYLIGFSDVENRQFVMIGNSPFKTGPSWQMKVVTFFVAKYKREHPRYDPTASGWYVADFSVPSSKLDLSRKKNMISIIFNSYMKILKRDFEDVALEVFELSPSDERLHYVKKNKKPICLAGVGDDITWNSDTMLMLPDREILLHSYKKIEDKTGAVAAELKRKGITGEIIWPILFPRIDQGDPIGYLRVSLTSRDSIEMDERLYTALYNTVEAIIASLRQANSDRIPIKASITDISLSGIGIELSNQALCEVLTNEPYFRTHLSYDRHHTPLELRLSRVHITRVDGEHVRIGARINGIQIGAGGGGNDSGLNIFRKALHGVRHRGA